VVSLPSQVSRAGGETAPGRSSRCEAGRVGWIPLPDSAQEPPLNIGSLGNPGTVYTPGSEGDTSEPLPIRWVRPLAMMTTMTTPDQRRAVSSGESFVSPT
jgi:hypothetical protein